MTLANILRVDAHLHRRLPADSQLCRRLQCWPGPIRTRSGPEAKPAISCGHCCVSSSRPSWPSSPTGSRWVSRSPEARAVLAIAPRPGAAAKLSVSRIGAALRRAGRSRGIDQTAAEINAGLRNPQLHQLLWSRLRWPTRAGSARGARHRVRRCRRPGSGVRGVVSDPSRLRDHHEFPRPGIRPDHPCVRTLDLGHPPPCQEQSAGQRRLDAGVLGCLQLASLPAGIIASGENTGTAMPPLPATCSTSSSANSTTASNIG